VTKITGSNRQLRTRSTDTDFVKHITSANSSKHDEARTWLAGQLAWERSLASLRASEDQTAVEEPRAA